MKQKESLNQKEPILWDILEHYGKEAQLKKAIEECAELIVANLEE